MRLTKYEYEHNKDGTRKFYRISEGYLPPVLRIIYICGMYFLIIHSIIDIFIYKNYNLYLNLFAVLISIILMIFALWHNPLFIVRLLIHLPYKIFSKKTFHKELVNKLESDYKNVIELEKKLHVSKLRISFYNPQKIIFLKNDKKGYVTAKKVCIGNSENYNDCSICNSSSNYINYLKNSISELYKKTKDK